MSCSVKTIVVFEKQAKRLVKKYASLKIELFQLVNELKENPKRGTPIGKNCYKIRLSIASKGKEGEQELLPILLFLTKPFIY